jgi:ketosteroid isomerase-like protein
MKKILFTFSIFLFFACVSNEDKAKIDGANQFVSGMEKFEKNKELADKGFDSFESGDLEGLFALVSDDLIWNPPHVDSLSKDDYVSGMKGWHSEFENFKFTERQYFPGVDDSLYLPNGSVRAYGVWKYNHKTSGTEFSTKYYSVSEFDESGLQTTIYEFFDRGDIFLKLQ